MSPGIPILTFHALGEPASLTAFSPEVFARGMAALSENGYQSVSIGEALDGGRTKESGSSDTTDSKERRFALTFDDGDRSVYDVAFPILKAHGMTATLFLTVGADAPDPSGGLPSFEGRSMLRWDEVREMQADGFTVGAHSLTHRDLRFLSEQEIESEMLGSKEAIQDVLGTPVEGFSYPYGRYDRRSAALARKHFDYACSDCLGLAGPGSQRHALERVDAYYLRTDLRFRTVLSQGFAIRLGLINVPRRIRRAIFGRGDCSSDSGAQA